jgi:hypothetical protein
MRSRSRLASPSTGSKGRGSRVGASLAGCVQVDHLFLFLDVKRLSCLRNRRPQYSLNSGMLVASETPAGALAGGPLR